MANPPVYNHAPIGSVRSLARALDVDESVLIDTADNSEKYWRPGATQEKKNGEKRFTNDARDPLKQIQLRIKDRILAKVLYPSYILGGIASDKYTHRSYIKHANTHAGSSLLLSEDIENFFPNTNATMVDDIWKNLFHFHPEVTALLTVLTTHNSLLPQGWITSNHLANLALWRHEADLVTKLEGLGFSYSRFVDDISVSSKERIDKESKTVLVSEVFGFIQRSGYAPKRSKHDLSTSNVPMKAVGLNVNGKKASKPKGDRRITRALVDHCVKYNPCARNSPDYIKMWDKASGQVGVLKQLHPAEAKQLRKSLSDVRPIRATKSKTIKRKQKRISLPPFSG